MQLDLIMFKLKPCYPYIINFAIKKKDKELKNQNSQMSLKNGLS